MLPLCRHIDNWTTAVLMACARAFLNPPTSKLFLVLCLLRDPDCRPTLFHFSVCSVYQALLAVFLHHVVIVLTLCLRGSNHRGQMSNGQFAIRRPVLKLATIT
ncbi:hypothetical protein BDZ89DRAFT_773478 [Hymenopellis radicata]|nr:hypothetical protein BDZ89DRAFT_773478 [Hymenopellis radicata]